MSDRENSTADESRSRAEDPRASGRLAPPASIDQRWPKHVPIPDEFLCSLGGRLMRRPVTDGEGNSYDRDTILRYLRYRRDVGSDVRPILSPVTKNPLAEDDLVDDGELQTAMEIGLRNALEQKKPTRAQRLGKKIFDPLRSSMQSAAHSLESKPTRSKNRQKSDVDYEAAFSSGEDEDEAKEEKAQRRRKGRASRNDGRATKARQNEAVYDSINTGDVVLDARVATILQAGAFGGSITCAFRGPYGDPQQARAEGREESPPSETKVVGAKDPASSGAKPISATSAADRFEERLRRKMAEDSASRSKYERRPRPPAHYEEYEEKLRRKNDAFGEGNDASHRASATGTGETGRATSGREASEASKEREEEPEERPREKNATAGKDGAGPEKRPRERGRNGSRERPEISVSDGIARSGTRDASNDAVVGREEANCTQSQERRRTKSRDGRTETDEKIRMSLASGTVSREKEGSGEEVNSMQKEQRRTKRRDRRTMLDEKIRMSLASGTVSGEKEKEKGSSERVNSMPQEQRRTKRRDRRTMLDEKIRTSLASGAVSGEKEKGSSPRLLGIGGRSESERRASEKREEGKEEKGRIEQTFEGGRKRTGPDKEYRLGRTEPPRRYVRFLQFAEHRRVSDLTTAFPEEGEDGGEASEPAAGGAERDEKSEMKIPDHLPGTLTKANSFRFERSDSVISWSDLDGALVQAEMESLKTSGVGPSETRGEFAESIANSDRVRELTGSTLNPSFRFERKDSVTSWTDLDADIERAMFLSMKEADRKSLESQVELETFARAGAFDAVVGSSRPPEGGGREGEDDDGSSPVVARARARVRRGKKEKRKPRRNDETFAYKMDSIMEVMEGTERTRFDVLEALKKTRGHREEALGLLLGSRSSSFTNRPAYN